MMKTTKMKIELLIMELNEPIYGHPSREAEIRAKRNEKILTNYLQMQLDCLKKTGRTI